MTTKIKKLACPKCKGTTFEVYLVTVEGFFMDGKPLHFTMERCTNCGWKTHPTNKEELKTAIKKVLKGETPKEGFVFAEGE